MKLSASFRPASRAIVLTLAIALTIILSPFVLLALGRLAEGEWAQLSNIGQAYGFTSALISATALFAVARSLRSQARQSRAAEVQVIRSMHVEMVRLMFDYPDICAPVFGKDPSNQESLQDVFRTFLFNFNVVGLEVGEIPELDIRKEVAEPFLTTQAGRDWWIRARPFHAGASASPGKQRCPKSWMRNSARSLTPARPIPSGRTVMRPSTDRHVNRHHGHVSGKGSRCPSGTGRSPKSVEYRRRGRQRPGVQVIHEGARPRAVRRC